MCYWHVWNVPKSIHHFIYINNFISHEKPLDTNPFFSESVWTTRGRDELVVTLTNDCFVYVVCRKTSNLHQILQKYSLFTSIWHYDTAYIHTWTVANKRPVFVCGMSADSNVNNNIELLVFQTNLTNKIQLRLFVNLFLFEYIYF